MTKPGSSIFDVPPVHHDRFWRPLLSEAGWYERSHREELERIIRAGAWAEPPSREMGESISLLLRTRLPACIAAWNVPRETDDAPAICDLVSFLGAWLLHSHGDEPHPFVWAEHGVLAIAAVIGWLPTHRLEAVASEIKAAVAHMERSDSYLAALLLPVVSSIEMAGHERSRLPHDPDVLLQFPENVNHDRDLLRAATNELARWSTEAARQFVAAAGHVTLD